MPGVPSFLNVFGIWTYVSWWRADANHHNFDLTSGPPAEPLKSLRCWTREPVCRPRAVKAESTLVDCRCQPSAEPPRKPEPRNVSPPSFGIKLTRTPPADDSAETPLVW